MTLVARTLLWLVIFGCGYYVGALSNCPELPQRSGPGQAETP